VSPIAGAIIAHLKAQANPANVAGMARYGIATRGTLGVPVHALRKLAKQVGRGAIGAHHELAAELWASGIHEARILATIVDIPALVTRRQMNRWARDFDSWDVCDQACQNLFRYTPFAFEKAAEWARARPEFVRRAGFALMAGLAVKARVEANAAPDAAFEAWLPLIAEAADDERNLVKKSVNWALRAIGKRNPHLHRQAVAAAEAIRKMNSPAARWIANDALRELCGADWQGHPQGPADC
jgi:3-methyladenine DNA glycosylase AlkD